MTLKSFFAGCWFGKHDRIRTRTAQQQSVYRCVDCGDEVPILAEAIVIGPAHQQVPDLGAITTKAVSAGKVTKIRKAG